MFALEISMNECLHKFGRSGSSTRSCIDDDNATDRRQSVDSRINFWNGKSGVQAMKNTSRFEKENVAAYRERTTNYTSIK